MKKKIFYKLYKDILVYFLLILFILSSIVWLLQAVNYLDIVSEDGHSFITYFKYSFLNFPKIISKVFLLSFFLALFYVLKLYEENNQLLIYWANGVSKESFLAKLLFLSTILIILSSLINLFLSPYTQDKARSFIRNSDLSFFPSLLKQKTFIDTVEDLTIFIEKKENNSISNVLLKDTKNQNRTQIIIANDGNIFNTNDEKFLNLFKGKIINKNLNNTFTILNFKESSFNLENFSTKTTTSAKIQELETLKLLECLLSLNNDYVKKFNNFNCSKDLKKNIHQELYKRLFSPIFIYLITISTSFIILKSHASNFYKKNIFQVFSISIFFIVLSEISVSLISLKFYFNILIILFTIITIISLYVFFKFKLKFIH